MGSWLLTFQVAGTMGTLALALSLVGAATQLLHGEKFIEAVVKVCVVAVVPIVAIWWPR